MTSISIPAVVTRLIEARAGHRRLSPPSEIEGELTVEQAYAIQEALRAELQRLDQPAIGWKLGATSASGQAVVGVKEPVVGFLLPERYASGADVAMSRFANLAVEAEVAFEMRTPLAGPGVTSESALRAVESAMPALELPDLMFSGKPQGVDFIANSVVANAIVLGAPVRQLQGLDLAREEVVCEHNGEVVGTYTGAEVMGNPLNALAWLANHLGTRGLTLKAGDIVMSGSISKVMRPKAGDTVRATYGRLGVVAARFV